MNARAFNALTRRFVVISKNMYRSGLRSEQRSFCSLEDEINEIFNDDKFENIKKQINHYGSPLLQRNVFVVQPRVKRGPEKFAVDSDYLLQETIALVETLHNWKVCASMVLPTTGLRKKAIFGSGNLEKLKNSVLQANCNTVVFSTDLLMAAQQSYLEDQLGAAVCDRYSIVLQIFNNHAKTREARLQIALAEIPYIRAKLSNFHTAATKDLDSSLVNAIGGSKEKLFSERKKILRLREGFLRKCLEKVSKQREIVKVHRIKNEIPSVAVVGYTNSGKTSLIKAITNDNSLEPKDQLFATLDVTAHLARLPQGQKMIFLDTVGFISNIPIQLIHAFNATLKDVVSSDLIVHVYDVSHPNVEYHRKAVANTLNSIGVCDKLMSSLIEVGNKMDCVNTDQLTHSDHIYISAKTYTNVSVLTHEIERRLAVNTNRLLRTVRIANGGELWQWLWRNATVVDVKPDHEDLNYAFVEVRFTESSFSKFVKFANKKDR